MINEVVLEGIVVREPWKFMDDLFFRLVIYRDSDLPAKKLDLERDAGDYINVRVNGGANGLIHIRRGMRLRVHGFLQSRDYRESMEEFISKPDQLRELLLEGTPKQKMILVKKYLLLEKLTQLLINSSSQHKSKVRIGNSCFVLITCKRPKRVENDEWMRSDLK